MGKINLYNVYDNGKLIMQKATRREIIDKIGCSTMSLTRYATECVMYQNRYSFEFYIENEKMVSMQELIFREKWEAAVAPFRNVIWVKTGGKQLKVGGANG